MNTGDLQAAKSASGILTIGGYHNITHLQIQHISQ